MEFTYRGHVYHFEERTCPHCGSQLEPWVAPPASGWDVVLVCNNDKCPHYDGSSHDIEGKRDGSRLGCRYAENPDNGYKPFNLLAVCPE